MMKRLKAISRNNQTSLKLWTSSEGDTKKPHQLIKRIAVTLKGSGNKEKAEQYKKYMRNQFEFYGVTTPERRELSKEFMKTELSQGEAYALTSLCWDQTERDFQYFASELLIKRPTLLLPRSEQYDPMELIRAMVVHKSWWDTIDMIASKLIGHLAKVDKEHTLSVLENWVEDENIWLKRCAILYQLNYKKDTDKQKLFRYCQMCSGHKDFFIQKAIGWALREYAKTNPKAVQKFVKENDKTLASLSKREALKHLK